MSTASAPSPPSAADGYATVNGLRFHYRVSGVAGAPVVLVLHGIMGHAREWDILTAALAEHFRVVAPDQRGHGETAWAGEYTVAAMADDLIALSGVLDVPRVHLVGHSMGAMAASLAAACRHSLVERLVMIDVGPDSLTSPWAVRELPAMLDALGETSYAGPQQAVHDWLAGDSLARGALVRHYVEHNLVARGDGRLVWRFDAEGLRRFPADGVTEEELWGALDRIAAPTLLIRGEHSELLSRMTAARMLRRLADGRLVEVTDGGHDLGVQQPEAVAAATLAFFRQ